MDLAGFVYLARQKTLSYQRCMKEVTHSQSTYIQQVGIGSCMYNVEPLYVSDRDIGNTVQDRGKTGSDAPFTHINFFPSITPCVARLPLCVKWSCFVFLAILIYQSCMKEVTNAYPVSKGGGGKIIWHCYTKILTLMKLTPK